MHLKQRDLHKQLRAEAIATRKRIAAMVRLLDSSKINEHPEPARWSVGQVLEHLCVADELYEAPLAALLRDARKDAGAPARDWKPSLIGGRIADALLKPRPLKSPGAFMPGRTPRSGVGEALLAREMKFVKTMDAAASFDWRALKIGSPALPSWAPKVNLGDGFRIHVVHLTRHSHQIARLIEKL